MGGFDDTITSSKNGKATPRKVIKRNATVPQSDFFYSKDNPREGDQLARNIKVYKKSINRMGSESNTQRKMIKEEN